ncbi:MAG: S8 family serine peptidase, partial [Phycisphaerae bacterium]
MNTRTVGTAGAFAGWHALVLWMAVAPAIALGGPVQPAGPAAADRRLAAPFSFQPDKPRGRGPIIHPSMVRRLQLIGGGRPVKAWVFFTDKGVASPEEYNRAIQETAAACHPRMLRRRALRRSRPGLLDRQDLPVVPRYVRAVEAGGARVHVVSRWLNGVSVRADQRQLAAIARLAFVRSIEPVRRARRVEPIAVPPASRGGQGSTTGSKGGFYGLSVDQLTQINLIAVHNQGFTGEGVVIGLLDTGFDRIHASFNDPLHPVRVVAERDFVDGDDVTSAQPGDPPGHTSHGTRVLSVIGAFWPGTLVGGAYDASFVLCKTEDTTSETPIEEDNFVAGLEFIEANGGDTATASLGYSAFYTQADMDGRTAVTTLGVNVATANGLHCVNSAGNGGHDGDPATSSISPPADAFQVISVGAVTADGTTAGFSSDGPTADGRIKPEVLARGVLTQTAFGTTGVSGANGTSFSAPLLASAVGCLVQAHPDWTVDQMRTYLFQTADRYASTETTDPTFVRGYGIIDTLAALGGDCNGNGVDDAVDIANGTAPDCDGNGVPDS